MRLFAQIAGTTYDIITPLRHIGDIVCVSTALGKIDKDAISHSHRIGGAYTFESKITLNLARHFVAGFQTNDVTIPCIAYNYALHCIIPGAYIYFVI